MVENIIFRDYDSFAGIMLERYFRDKFIQLGMYTNIGMYWNWNRKGENEIDLIAINELEKTAGIYEIKMNEARYSEAVLEEKVENLLIAEAELKKYALTFGKLSLENM